MKKATYALFIFLLLVSGLSAQNSFFEVVSPREAPTPVEVVKNIKNMNIVRLNEQAMRAYLLNAPMEFQNNGISLPLEIPLPNGKTEVFGIVESPILSPEVAAQNPEIKTYTGNGLSNKKAIIRLSLTSDGFNAILLNVEGDAVYFQKYSEQSRDMYFNYFTRDVVVPQNGVKTKSCGIGLHEDDHDHDHGAVAPERSPELMMGVAVTLKTYRLAMAANGEFTAERGGNQTTAFNDVVGYVNRMTALYRRDLGVNFTLVSGTNLIYTNAATDPYDNNDQGAMLDENHNNCNTVIGAANYDIGHVWGYVGSSGGGVAYFQSLCNAGIKGGGVSGEGDLSSYAQVFMDQLLFHEVGHQFGMSHSYNSSIPVCTTRNPATSVEPGSGATVMSYGFTCDTDDYFSTGTPQTGPILQFHAASLAQANAYIAGGGNCFSSTATGNTSPDVTGPSNFTIPKSTPFALTGSATDVDSDAMTFCWEGMNIGTITPDANTLTDLTQPPFFRSYGIPDSSDATRTYPLLSAVLNGTNNAKGDKLPSLGIATTHRLTVRDNNAAGGGVSFADVTVTVNGAIGPFLETTNLGGSYAALSTQTITWSVNGTSAATPNVKISLSTDGGLSFPITLLASTANDGSELVTLPNNPTTTARIKVEAVGNIFFDISNVNFTITPAAVVTCPSNFAVCVNAPAFDLTGGNPTGGTYSGTGVSAGVFNPAVAGVGMHTITYTNGTSCTFVITVNALPTPVITGTNVVCDGGSVTLDAGAGYSSYAWSNGGGTGQTATFTNILATTTYYVTVTNAAGCSGTASFTVTKDDGDLPSGWSNNNVGSANGSASFSPCSGDGGTFTVSATGFSTSSSDVLHAAYQQICGNTEVIARVLTVSSGGWGGVMIRETLMPGSKKASIKTQLTSNIRREIRTVTNGAATILNYIRPQHVWLRLVRTGTNIVGYSSINGTSWSFAFSATVNMTGCVYVGIFSESINNATTNTATFDNVTVTGSPAPLIGDFPSSVLDESGDHVQIYPNPNTGEMSINLDVHTGKPGVIQIFNALGEMVSQERLVAGNPETHTMRIINGAGVYTVVIQLDDRRIVRRVVVNQGN